MSISRGKSYCPECDTVRKGPGAHGKADCPGQFEYMGTRWRPGRKGSRDRMYSSRQARRAQQNPPKYTLFWAGRRIYHRKPTF